MRNCASVINLPVLFDFTIPAKRDITETISLLARMARFVVADHDSRNAIFRHSLR